MNPAPLVALVGNPNAGKSALFNALTGARQKVGNYPGVTVERKSGRLALSDGRPVELVDLPGTYSLDPVSPDEAVTRDVVMGRQAGERVPAALIVVVDASNLDNHLRFTLQLVALGLPVVVALNMIDMAERDGLKLDPEALSRELGVPVVPTVAVRRRGIDELREALSGIVGTGAAPVHHKDPVPEDIAALQRRARAISVASTLEERGAHRWSHLADGIALHPIFGPILLAVLMFVMFQAVFTSAQAPMDMIDGWKTMLGNAVTAAMPAGFLRTLLVTGIIDGVGAVVVFLPQILILFFFILLLEASGYMVRAAFLMDRLMAGVGLSGRAFIPLLSSFACAIPGIMATRTIDDPKDRLTTILIAPLMTCSARLPVYAVIIGAFIPNKAIGPGIGLQGLVLFGLYGVGIVTAMLAALILRRTVAKGAHSGFLMELPKYQMPSVRDIAIGLLQRAWIFLRRAGTIILQVSVALCILLALPQAPKGQNQLEYSFAGRIASVLDVIVKPIGFNHEMAVAIIPAMAAREVAVSALAQVYAIQSDGEGADKKLSERLHGRWSLPTALAFLMWFAFAPQCMSTIAVMRRETNGWKWPLFALAYLFALAWCAAGATFWTATALGL
jgi:ferrous iron transport protein B